jgi:hypothetical protein
LRLWDRRVEWTPPVIIETNGAPTAAAPPVVCGVDEIMKHEGELAGRELTPRDARIEVGYDVAVEGPAGRVAAELINISSEGFRLRCDEPLETGWEVTLEASRSGPLRAVIIWACGLDAGGVFMEPIAL